MTRINGLNVATICQFTRVVEYQLANRVLENNASEDDQPTRNWQLLKFMVVQA